MGEGKNTISYASFITKFWCWLIFYLQRKRAFKYVLLFSVVLFCTLTRYVILSFDKVNVKEVKTAPVNLRHIRFPFAFSPAAHVFKSELSDVKQKYLHKIKPLSVRKDKSSSLYIYAFN